MNTPPESEFMSTTHVAVIHSTDSKTIDRLLNATPCDGNHENFAVEQKKGPDLEHLLCMFSTTRKTTRKS